LRAAGIKKARTPLTTVSAVLGSPVTLEPQADGTIAACFGEHSITLGMFSADTAERARDLHTGLPLASFASGRRPADKEIDLLVRRLARHGLLAYGVRRSRQDDAEQAIIEPQIRDYWPHEQELGDDDVLVLSRFACMRRRGNEMVLESPRAGALFKICDPQTAAIIAMLAQPHSIRKLRRQDGFPGIALLALLADCQILFKPGTSGDSGLRPAEGDGNLVLWDFHDLLFHTRSTAGRHANPLGGLYSYADVTPPLPAVRPRWPGKPIDLRIFSGAPAGEASAMARLLRERHSTRMFDDAHPITIAELSQFLDATARVLSVWKPAPYPPPQEGEEYQLNPLPLAGEDREVVGDDSETVEVAARPYPSAGASYELELYLAVDKCEGLGRGFYHYDAGGHALVPIQARPQEVEALLGEAQFAMGVPAAPQVLITIAARFGRVSWKYSSIAYALILKDAGVLIQTFYLAATDMGLGGCATGISNIDLFAKMTGIEFHVEGPVGQFAMGRAARDRS
jgi:SagB-type dehydrogenase family enzyme